MKLIILFVGIFVGWIYLTNSAVIINELAIDAIYCNNSLPLASCYTRVQRKNKTSQLITGNLTLKLPFTNDILAILQLNYMDRSGIWKGFITRHFNKACDTLFGPNGIAKDQWKRFFKGAKNECPLEKGTYIAHGYVNRYRRDWEADLKFLIPPMMMEVDKWNVNVKYFYTNDTKTVIGEVNDEFRLLNEYMSQ